MGNKEIFKSLRYGMMIHFGLYSLLGGEWRGKKGPAYAEWTECYLGIPNSEMEALRESFDPYAFDADNICRLARDAGMRYIVITAKHHEGFALFDSKVDSFNVMNTPFGRDIIKEMAESCKKYGLKLGFYYSQVIDWHERNGGGFACTWGHPAGPSWSNTWDWPSNEGKDYEITFRNKIIPQVKELLTNYGPVFLMWFDMPLDSTKEQSRELYDLVKELQSECLVNSRLGNDCWDYVTFGDNIIPESIPSGDDEGDRNDIWRLAWNEDGLYESCGTMNGSWGWSKTDEEWKSAETLAMNRLKLEKLGINYLLNVGPDATGAIPEKARKLLLDAKNKYDALK